ncbi:hypothetical protein EAO76_10420, partial [Streptomyces sp. sk2.1]
MPSRARFAARRGLDQPAPAQPGQRAGHPAPVVLRGGRPGVRGRGGPGGVLRLPGRPGQSDQFRRGEVPADDRGQVQGGAFGPFQRADPGPQQCLEGRRQRRAPCVPRPLRRRARRIRRIRSRRDEELLQVEGVSLGPVVQVMTAGAGAGGVRGTGAGDATAGVPVVRGRARQFADQQRGLGARQAGQRQEPGRSRGRVGGGRCCWSSTTGTGPNRCW